MAFMVPFTVMIDYDTLTKEEKISLAKKRGDKKLHEKLATDLEPEVRLALLYNPKLSIQLVRSKLICDDNEMVRLAAKEYSEKFELGTGH